MSEHPSERTKGNQGSGTVILLTGRPGVGKTTAVRRIAVDLGSNAAGFYTRKVRSAGQRTGFELVTLRRKRVPLAVVQSLASFPCQSRCGRNWVNLTGIETVGVPALRNALRQGQIIVVDEIGSMEMLSTCICDSIERILDSDAAAVGSIVKP